ncbi:MAG TPA: glycine cleavage system protein H [Prosthecobacter sp.]|nr:glycine cleavage system protein H [Prosthecobacter sp.]HRK15906.1 glycine cleavage system protein H [Prosthecobacter sp.]
MPLPTVRFKHARFSARFPESYRYSRSHYWMAPVEGQDGVWRVGFTKFATRMLGELVDSEWKKQEGDDLAPGDIVGWVEGFKAASDVYSVMLGAFVEGNPHLKQDACIVRSDPYEVGWLYAVRGEPEEDHLDVHGYIDHLSTIIQRMAEEGHGEEGAAEE